MKLLVISHTPHYLRDETIVGWGPTVRDLDALAQLFDEIVHIAPCYAGKAPESSLPYQSPVKLWPVRPAGGESLVGKLGIIQAIPQYVKTILKGLAWADAVQVRCPANISLIALVLLAMRSDPKYRWVKYAGNWKPQGKEAASYTFQRWFLCKNLHRGAVSVNGEWPDQARHIYSFYNPSFSVEQVSQCAEKVRAKELSLPLELLFVGQLNQEKGVGRVLEIARELADRDVPFRLHLLGDGPLRQEFEKQASQLEVIENVCFHGWLARDHLDRFYAKGHFILLPSSSEGWPKVLSEGMAYGVVPIASAISSIPPILATLKSGRAIPVDLISTYADTVVDYMNNPQQWKLESQAGVASSRFFTYQYYQNSVRHIFKDQWGIEVK